jgi:hypothetical protein
MDYTRKRREYEAFGVVEYWRFDPSGGEYHDAALAGDRLVDGRFVPIETERIDDRRQRGYSESLGLYLCWEDGELRWYDPARGEYLQTYEEVSALAERESARANEEAVARRIQTARAERAEAELRELRQRMERLGHGEG